MWFHSSPVSTSSSMGSMMFSSLNIISAALSTASSALSAALLSPEAISCAASLISVRISSSTPHITLGGAVMPYFSMYGNNSISFFT